MCKITIMKETKPVCSSSSLLKIKTMTRWNNWTLCYDTVRFCHSFGNIYFKEMNSDL